MWRHKEADELCAKLVVKKAFACLSEDMDMFVYGCPKVLRYLSLLNETVVVYTQKDMLDVEDHSGRVHSDSSSCRH